MLLGIVNGDAFSSSTGQAEFSSFPIVNTSTIVRPDTFVGSNPPRPIRSSRVQLFLEQTPHGWFGSSRRFPQKQRQSVEQPLARVAPGKRIGDGFEAKRFQVQQIVSPR